MNIKWIVNHDSNTVLFNPTNITYLEHVILQLSLQLSSEETEDSVYSYDDYYDALFNDPNRIYDILFHNQPRRGDISVTLTSPSGTKSILLPYRNRDFIVVEGYEKWPFLSLQFWGENPSGIWTCSVSYKGNIGSVTVSDVKLKLYGVVNTPFSVKNMPTVCPTQCHLSDRCSTNTICDTCKEFRDSITLQCLSLCQNNTQRVNNYCVTDENSKENSGIIISPSKSLCSNSIIVHDTNLFEQISSTMHMEDITIVSVTLQSRPNHFTPIVNIDLKHHGLSNAQTIAKFPVILITITLFVFVALY